MISELHTYRAAKILIEQYGTRAALEAVTLADQMLDRGNLEGAGAWLRVLRVIEDIQRTAPNHGEHVQ